MQSLASTVRLSHKANLASKILEELNASIIGFNKDEFEELISKYEIKEKEESKCLSQKEKPNKK